MLRQFLSCRVCFDSLSIYLQHLFAITSLNWSSSYCKTGWGVRCSASVCWKDSITFVMFSKAINLIIHKFILSYYLWTLLMTSLVERCSEKPYNKETLFSFLLPINSCSLHRKFFICCSGQYLLWSRIFPFLLLNDCSLVYTHKHKKVGELVF